MVTSMPASADFHLPPVDVRTYEYVRWFVDHTGATAAGDLITIDAYAEEPTAG